MAKSLFKRQGWPVLGILIGVSVPFLTYAAGFQIFDQDGASIGNYHAGYAAIAEDASTAFYNPAGLTRFKNQQATFSTIAVMPDVKYTGTVNVDTIAGGPFPVTVEGGAFAFIPALHYVAPISELVSFGFSVDVPFGAKTSYGESTYMKYNSTQTSVTVVDFSPSLGVKVTDKASLGAGFDVQTMDGEFDQVGTIGGEELESDGVNHADGTGYGYHAGVLYEFNDATRAGLSYHSQVVHHLSGTSSFTGKLAQDFLDGDIYSRSTINITLPAYTALSVYHKPNPKFAFMSSVMYTQWNVIKNLTLHNAAGALGGFPSTNITVTIPQYFRNTWNLSVGGNYYATDKIMIRTGLGFDQTPVQNAYRNPQLPDNDRYVIALGAHYQATKTIGMDISWNHVFLSDASIAPPPQVTGDQVTTVNGSSQNGADVLAAQLTWNIT